jgi:hypothetical protein
MNLDDEERAGTRSRKHVKQKSLRLLSFIFMLLLLIFLYNLQPNQKTQVNVISKDIFEIKKHFKDTEEWTDYSFLRAQLTGKCSIYIQVVKCCHLFVSYRSTKNKPASAKASRDKHRNAFS